MPNQNTIKIPVKKADGSMVYLTMEEIKAMKDKQKKPAPKKPISVLATKDIYNKKQKINKSQIKDDKSRSAIQNSVQDLAEKLPDSKKDPDIQQYDRVKKFDKSFHSSPLSEKLDTSNTHLSKLSPSRDNEVDEIIKKLNITIPPDNLNRFRSILQLRLKDIRDDYQTEEALKRSVLDGGMGFSSQQVKQVLSVIVDTLSSSFKIDSNTSQSIKSPHPAKSQLVMTEAKEDLPIVYKEPPIPSTTTPNKHIFEHSSDNIPVDKKDFNIQQNDKNNSAEKLKLNSNKQNKKIVLHDIVSPANMIEFGPVEEIANFTWHDFRNLSAEPVDAAQRLAQKIKILKDESYVLYMQGKQAYYRSPLFIDYMKVVDQALRNRQSLQEVLDKKSDLKLEEIQALIEMEGKL